MIVVDTSALLAILFAEPEADAFARCILATDAHLPAPAYVEAALRVEKGDTPAYVPGLDLLIASLALRFFAFTEVHARAARSALVAFGKGRHALNFGDCMVYAVAKLADAPLLYKGEDFALTDLRPAL